MSNVDVFVCVCVLCKLISTRAHVTDIGVCAICVCAYAESFFV